MLNSLKKYPSVIFVFFLLIYSTLPYVANAASASLTWMSSCPPTPQNFRDFICISLKLVRLTVIYAASSAVLAFIWGLSKFILASGSEEKIADGKWIMKWGVIGLFFMFSVWGVVQVVATGILGPGYFGIPLLPQ